MTACSSTDDAAAPTTTALIVSPVALRPVDRQKWRRLGEAVDLDELPPQLVLDPLDRLRRRRSTGADDARRAAGAGHRRSAMLPWPIAAGVEDRIDDRGCGAQ